MANYWCPVCGYDGLYEPPYDHYGSGSYEICSSCGYEYGVTDDDRMITHAQWRRRWIESGMKWRAAPFPSPAGWDPADQLAKHDLATATISSLWMNQARLRGKSVQTQTVPQGREITLPLAGRSVVRTFTRYASSVSFADGYSLTIEAPFAIIRGDSRAEFTPDSGHDDPAAVAELVGLEVSTAVVSSTGALHIEFSDGTNLEVTPDGQSEPWNLSTPQSLLVVSMPSGELAIWSGQA